MDAKELVVTLVGLAATFAMPWPVPETGDTAPRQVAATAHSAAAAATGADIHGQVAAPCRFAGGCLRPAYAAVGAGSAAGSAQPARSSR